MLAGAFNIPALAGRPLQYCSADIYVFPAVSTETSSSSSSTPLERRALVVTLRNERALNALPPLAHRELSHVWNAFDADDSLLVGIVTGAGKRAFCSGFDLKYAAQIPVTGSNTNSDAGAAMLPELDPVDPSKPPDNMGIRGGSGFGGLTDRRDRIKPIIAAVNGLAHGGGFEIVLATDIVLAVPSAEFALPEPRVGLVALAGGMVRLPRVIGYGNAMEIMLTCRRVSADEALRLGVVQRIVAPGKDLLEEALDLAERIMAASPDAVQATMQVARRSLYEQLDPVDAIQEQSRYPTIQRLHSGANRAEGNQAFVEKRSPIWQLPAKL